MLVHLILYLIHFSASWKWHESQSFMELSWIMFSNSFTVARGILFWKFFCPNMRQRVVGLFCKGFSERSVGGQMNNELTKWLLNLFSSGALERFWDDTMQPQPRNLNVHSLAHPYQVRIYNTALSIQMVDCKLSSPKGLRAESARAFTGRRNSHSGRGGGTKNTNFQNSMGALSNPISFAPRISELFLFLF